jgi:hypothetical protein
MELLLKERIDLEMRIKNVNQKIRSFGKFIDPIVYSQIKDILGDNTSDSSCIGIIEVRKTLNIKDRTEIVTVHFVYDCAIGGRRCQHDEDSLFTRHNLSIEFDVCYDMLTVSVECDEEHNSDFEGGFVSTGLIDLTWSNINFNNDHIIIHDKLGTIHKLQYDIYRLWYDKWKKGTFNARSV